MAALLYGAGLRLMECLRLRVQVIDFSHSEITIRDGKWRQGPSDECCPNL
jgi:integrase